MQTDKLKKREDEIYEMSRAIGRNNIPKNVILELSELRFRSMINSCMCYGSGYGSMSIWDDDNNCWGHYALDYVKELGDARAHKIWDEQREFFHQHANILYNVYVDSEGGSYNSIDWR